VLPDPYSDLPGAMLGNLYPVGKPLVQACHWPLSAHNLVFKPAGRLCLW